MRLLRRAPFFRVWISWCLHHRVGRVRKAADWFLKDFATPNPILASNDKTNEPNLRRQEVEAMTRIIPVRNQSVTRVIFVCGMALSATLSLLASASDADKSKTAGDISIADCDFSVAGTDTAAAESTDEERSGAEDSVLRKLAQFDECLDRLGDASAEESGTSGAAGGGGGDEADGSSLKESELAGDDSTQPDSTKERNSEATSDPVRHSKVTAARLAAEDNIAAVLRQAAEAETDPELEAELWKQYENYMKSKEK